jgi:hypothetical protein
MRIRVILPLLAAALATAACDKNPTGTTPTETSFTFEYRLGAEATWRAFESRGQQPPGTELSVRGEWVHTLADNLYAFMLAQQRLPSGTWVTFAAQVPLLDAGTTIDIVPVNTPCASGRRCVNAGFTLAPTDGSVESCRFSEGSYEITRRKDAWLSATFSGRGTCTRGGVQQPFEVRSGEFDVEVPQAPA